MVRRAIEQYYEETESDYRLVWCLEKEKALHYGFWDKTTWTFRQALRRTNEILAQRASVKKHDRVLDAGCGVGGSAIFLAKTRGCRVTGITLSSRQVTLAKQYALEAGVERKTTFCVADYLAMPFPRNSFDVVWAVESSCYMSDKVVFAREMKRVLASGGRLILSDFFRTETKLTRITQKHYRAWADGWAVKEFQRIEQFRSALKQAGFKNIIIEDATNNIRSIALRQFVAFFPGLLVRELQWLVRPRSIVQEKNLWAAYHQYKALRQDAWRYYILSATA